MHYSLQRALSDLTNIQFIHVCYWRVFNRTKVIKFIENINRGMHGRAAYNSAKKDGKVL